MAVPRATQFVALRNLSRSGQQVRHLHMTGPATYSSPVLIKERAAAVDEHSHSRAFSSASEQPKRPSTTKPEPKPVRHFNTSRSLKAVNDSSTIDFAYLPTSAFEDSEAEVFRVPILPNNFTTKVNTPEAAEAPVMKPEISTMSADAVYLPMSDLSDGHAMNVDFHAMADKVALNLRRMKVPVEEQASIMKQIWADMVDDMLGVGKKAAA